MYSEIRTGSIHKSMYNVRACACVIKLIKMCLLNKNCFSAKTEKHFKIPTETSNKKRKRSVNLLFLSISMGLLT